MNRVTIAAIACLVGLVVVNFCGRARATTIAYDQNGANITAHPGQVNIPLYNTAFDLGNNFTVNAGYEISVSSLGFVGQTEMLQRPIVVKLWNLSGPTEVAGATFGVGTTPTADVNWTFLGNPETSYNYFALPIAPMTLPAGTYQITSYGQGMHPNVTADPNVGLEFLPAAAQGVTFHNGGGAISHVNSSYNVGSNGGAGIAASGPAGGTFTATFAYDVTTAPQPPEPVEFWSVDLQATGGTVMSGVEPAYGYGNVWNAVGAPSYPVVTQNLSVPLVDGNGLPSPATFSVLTPFSTFNAPGFDTVLTQDFFVFNVGGLPSQMDWQIGGLTPGGLYEMYNYRTPVLERGFVMSIDTDSDGSLDTTQSIPSAATGSGASNADRGALFPTFIAADAAGTIHGTLAGGGINEVNWGGFQLRAVPEPSSIVLLALGLIGLAVGLRRRGGK